MIAPAQALHIAVGVLRDRAGRVLVAQRPHHVHQGGLWEFPGGKLESDESTQAALRRELAEEIGVTIDASRPLIRVRHAYADREVVLHVHLVERWSGRPRGREGQTVRWQDPKSLNAAQFPAADLPIITALRLPPVYLITPEPDVSSPAATQEFLDRLSTLLNAGVRLCQLRAVTADEHQLRALCSEVRAIDRDEDVILVVNGRPMNAVTLGVDGIHLSASRLLQLNTRPLGRERVISASCHNAMEVEHANRIGVDLITLSPVEPSRYNPDLRPLGWRKFQALAERSACPVYALGGMQMEDLPRAWQAGGQGVAAIAGLWTRPHHEWSSVLR